MVSFWSFSPQKLSHITYTTNKHITSTATYLEELSIKISGDGLHEVDGSLSRVVGGPDFPQVNKDGLDRHIDGLKIVGCMKLMDWKVFHQRVVVIHLLLSFLQT